ncbi:MAG TPA: PASTA domain-containing protein [Steroidobacteraceae bacterium]|nr:PASTA domain-containing protein [Steroidobacteraceae bacterium]
MALVWLLVSGMSLLALTACGAGGGAGPTPPPQSQVAVPNVVGLASDAAGTAIAGAGLGLGTVTTASSATVASGSIISEMPAAGTMVAPNSNVSVVISSGPAQVAVPDVVGMTQASATASITGVGLVIGTVELTTSATVTAGNVISQSPAAALDVSSGSTVNLIVSSGPAATQVEVPNVVGMTQQAATAAIMSAGLSLGGFATETDAVVAPGDVINVSPMAGTEVVSGSNVFLTISSGGTPSPVTVPNVVGLTETAAITSIAGAALVLGNVTTVSSTTLASGSIIGQSPTAASTVESGSTVNLIVSSGAGGNFAYVANGAGTLSAYSRNIATGALTPLSPATITVVASPPTPSVLYGIAIDPSGKFLYVLGYYVLNGTVTGGIYGYAINPGDGSLGAVPGSPFVSGGSPWSIVFDSTGAYAYVSSLDNGTVAAYALDQATGALTALTKLPYNIGGAAQPNSMIRVADHIYTADSFANPLQLFTILAGSGLLDEGGIGGPFAIDPNTGASLVANASGSMLLVPSSTSDTSQTYDIMAFSISWYTGELTPLNSNPMLTTTSSLEAIDPSNQFLFFTQPAGVEVYPVNTTTGIIGSAVAGSPFATSDSQANASPSAVTFDSTGKFVYVVNRGSESLSGGTSNGGGIAVFTFDNATGAISKVPGPPSTAGANPIAIAIR